MRIPRSRPNEVVVANGQVLANRFDRTLVRGVRADGASALFDVIHGRATSRDVADEFVRACRDAARQPGHPHVARVVDGLADERGNCVVVLDDVEGVALSDLDVVDEARLLHWAVCLADAVEWIDRRGRSVSVRPSPGWIRLTEQGEPVLIDVGLVPRSIIPYRIDRRPTRRDVEVIPPELLSGAGSHRSSAAYSLAATLRRHAIDPLGAAPSADSDPHAPGSDEAGPSETRVDEAGQDETGASETGASETGVGEARPTETREGETGASETGVGVTGAGGVSDSVVRGLLEPFLVSDPGVRPGSEVLVSRARAVQSSLGLAVTDVDARPVTAMPAAHDDVGTRRRRLIAVVALVVVIGGGLGYVITSLLRDTTARSERSPDAAGSTEAAPPTQPVTTPPEPTTTPPEPTTAPPEPTTAPPEPATTPPEPTAVPTTTAAAAADVPLVMTTSPEPAPWRIVFADGTVAEVGGPESGVRQRVGDGIGPIVDAVTSDEAIWLVDTEGRLISTADGAGQPSPPLPDQEARVVAAVRADPTGLWLLTNTGQVLAVGGARSLPAQIDPTVVGARFVDAVSSLVGVGFTAVDDRGGTVAVGLVPRLPAAGDVAMPVVAASAGGDGSVTLLLADGTVTRADGSVLGVAASRPGAAVVDLVATVTGAGAWVLHDDGHVDMIGDAFDYGSTLAGARPAVGFVTD